MTIAVLLTELYDIEDYDGLQAYLIAKLELDSVTATQLPTFIRLAEYRLDRLLTVPQRESETSLTTTAGTKTVQLPSDIRSVEAIKGLKQMPLAALLDHYGTATGAPKHYAIGNQQITLGPTPNAETTLELTYLTRLAPLSSANSTNWLLSNNGDAYVYATAARISDWLEDLDAATRYDALATAIIDEINEQANEYRNGTPLVPDLGCVP